MALSACVYLDYYAQQEITSYGISDGISSIVVRWVILDAMREKGTWMTCRFFSLQLLDLVCNCQLQ